MGISHVNNCRQSSLKCEKNLFFSLTFFFICDLNVCMCMNDKPTTLERQILTTYLGCPNGQKPQLINCAYYDTQVPRLALPKNSFNQKKLCVHDARVKDCDFQYTCDA